MLPRNIEAEKTIIATSVHFKKDCIKALSLRAEWFYEYKHRVIWATIQAIAYSGKTVDVPTVYEHLEESDKNYFLQVSEHSVSANVDYYIQIIKYSYLLRGMVKTYTESINNCKKEIDPYNILSGTEQRISNIFSGTDEEDMEEIGSVAERELRKTEKIINGEIKQSDLKIGLPPVDKLVNLFPGDLTIVAGRPSHGKSSLVMRMLLNVANAGMKCALFSLEMNKTSLSHRVIAMESGIALYKIRNSRMRKDEVDLANKSIKKIKDYGLVVNDGSEYSVDDIYVKCIGKRYSLIIVDYLQLLTGEGKKRHEVIAGISRSLKSLAKKLNTHVIAVSQLSRYCEQKGKMWEDKRPELSDLRESGQIEQDADTVMFVFRPEVYEEGALDGKAEIIVSKQRNGPIGTILLSYHKETTNFYSVE